MKDDLDSKLQIEPICSNRIWSRKWDIFKLDLLVTELMIIGLLNIMWYNDQFKYIILFDIIILNRHQSFSTRCILNSLILD